MMSVVTSPSGNSRRRCSSLGFRLVAVGIVMVIRSRGVMLLLCARRMVVMRLQCTSVLVIRLTIANVRASLEAVRITSLDDMVFKVVIGSTKNIEGCLNISRFH